MEVISRIMIIIISFFQMFSFIFPSFNEPTPDVPDEPSIDVEEEEDTTVPEPEIPQTCQHIGGDASCMEKAVCIRCGEAYGDFAAHDYDVVVQKVSCTSDGYTRYTCKVCLYSYVENEQKALGHNYTETVIEVTCTTAGKTICECKNCGDTYEKDVTAALGHNYTKTQTPADCVNPGYFIYTCENCGDVYKELSGEVAGEHNYVAVVTPATCREGGYTTHTCSGCNDSYVTDETPALGHSFTNYVPDNNATCTMDGTKTAYCDNGCGLISTLFIEGSQLDHNDTDGDGLCDYCKTEIN